MSGAFRTTVLDHIRMEMQARGAFPAFFQWREVRFVMHKKVGDVVFPELLYQVILVFSAGIIGNNDNRHVDGPDHLHAFTDTELSKGSGIVDAGGVDYDGGADAKDLHRFFHGVGGGSCRIGNNGNILSGQGIDEGTLAIVPSPENAYMGFIFTSFFHALPVFHRRSFCNSILNRPICDN